MVREVRCGQRSVSAKPLQVLWENNRGFSAKNTIMIDDLPSNFMLNPQSGLVIKPYVDCKSTKSADNELLQILSYLRKIAKVEDFKKLHHHFWRVHI